VIDVIKIKDKNNCTKFILSDEDEQPQIVDDLDQKEKDNEGSQSTPDGEPSKRNKM